jgi:hypothetical protein
MIKKPTNKKIKKEQVEVKPEEKQEPVSSSVVEPEMTAGASQPPVTEVKPEGEAETKTELSAEVPADAEPEAVKAVQPEAVLARNTGENLGTSIDNLAKIVDRGEVKAEPKPAEEPKTDKKTGYLWIVLSFITGLLLGIGVGWFLWGRGGGQVPVAETGVVPTTVQQPTGGDTAVVITPTTAPVKSQLKLQVLNGTEGKGVAAKASDTLKNLGYGDIVIGNAPESNHQVTEISLKPSKTAYLAGLKKDLSDNGYVLSDTVKDLAENGDFDAVIVIGLK